MVDTYGKKAKSVLFILVIMFIGEIKHRDYFLSVTGISQQLLQIRSQHTLSMSIIFTVITAKILTFV